MDESQASVSLNALAQVDRLKITRLLVRKGPQGAAAGEIAKELGIAPSRLSFHLAALEKGGLVHKTRSAQKLIYRLDFNAMRRLTIYLTEECCQDQYCDC